MLSVLLGAMTEQTRAITQLVSTGAGNTSEFSSLLDTSGGQRYGARGSEKIVKLREEYIQNPRRITQAVRHNLHLNPVLGHATLEQASMMCRWEGRRRLLTWPSEWLLCPTC